MQGISRGNSYHEGLKEFVQPYLTRRILSVLG